MTAGVVIVGASVAGVRTAQALRGKGYLHPITLIDAEAYEPYDKPPLSKGVLTGEHDPAGVRLLADGEAERLGLTLQLGSRVRGLDDSNRRVILDGDDQIPYSQLVIATGARARRPDWSHAPGVFVLRSLSDVEALRGRVGVGTRLVIVGSGFIGAEAASGARALGADVTLVDPLTTPMARLLTDSVGELFRDMHRSHADTEFGFGVVDIVPTTNGLEVELDDSRRLSADVVLVGVGVELNTEWLEGSSIHLDNGVVCDEFGRTTDRTGSVIDDVAAVGDVSRWRDPASGEHVRVEHWTNAVEQAEVLAHNIVHPDELISHTPSYYVWSDQYDWKIQLIGNTRAADVMIEHDGDRFAAFYAEAGRLVGAITVNWPRLQLQARRAIAGGSSRDELVAAARTVRRAPVDSAAGVDS